MELTRHAGKRTRQRGFSKLALDIIKQYGNCENAPGGATKVFLGKREHQDVVSELKKAIQALDKAKGGTLIVEGDDILTVYKR